jgi:transcription elongation factor GreA
MSRKQIYLTPEGQARLEVELAELKGPKREELAQRLRDSIENGDLAENADYISAKEDQAFLEGRIQEIEIILSKAIIIDKSLTSDGEVALGSLVTIKEGRNKPEKYLLVGASEANPRDGRISNESPIGKALLGHFEGDEVVADTPGGPIKFEILKIE